MISCHRLGGMYCCLATAQDVWDRSRRSTATSTSEGPLQAGQALVVARASALAEGQLVGDWHICIDAA